MHGAREDEGAFVHEQAYSSTSLGLIEPAKVIFWSKSAFPSRTIAKLDLSDNFVGIYWNTSIVFCSSLRFFITIVSIKALVRMHFIFSYIWVLSCFLWINIFFCLKYVLRCFSLFLCNPQPWNDLLLNHIVIVLGRLGNFVCFKFQI